MSRLDRETFVKSQLEAIQKALTKLEMPLKPKHARRIIVGTHQERSSNIFWNTVSRMQLEKNPVISWKFCHLVHKLIRDGHRKVPEESYRFISRLKQLGQFWRHLNTSGYGICNEIYSKLICERLEFHKKEVFRRTKKFYEESSNLQYFKYLVSVPTLPSTAPNFLQASDLDSYQTPHAQLYGDGSEDGQSVAEEALVAFDDEPVQQPSPASQPDPRDEQLVVLQRAVEDERFAKERLIAEARSRIEQYENRLAQMQAECDHARREAEEQRDERNRLQTELATRDASRVQSDDARVREAEERARASEERFNKMKGVYDKFKAEHVQALTKLGDLSKQLEASEKAKMDKEEELTIILRRLEEAQKSSDSLSSKAAGDAAAVDELRTQLAKADIEMEEMRRALDHEREKHSTALVQASSDFGSQLSALEKKLAQDIQDAVENMIQKADEDLQNATSISFPPHLAQSSISQVLSLLENLKLIGGTKEIINSVHNLTITVVSCASAAYTASIQHFDGVNEQCKKVLSKARIAFSEDSKYAMDEFIEEVKTLEELMAGLPLQTDVDKNVVGSELELEMKRMDEVIKHAVEQIEAIQRKARQGNDKIRLQVNESILGMCQQLMSAIMQLVVASRELQMEIVAAGRGGGSPAEFYKRNHQWTEGLLSAAKAVGVAARVLVEAADGVVTGQGKFEQLIVAAQEIAASTAQLFVSSRVKADRDSKKLAELSTSSRKVNQCTAQVVATVKSGQTTLNEKDVLDFSHLSLHDAKKEEMESQVHMLELEQALNRERAKLAALRKQHYHMAALVAKENGGNGDFEMIGDV
ncbi:hypothetical protein WR25_04529 [Diploscapter pachys]|uniref:I/LWEQ domain-containing protein n=1 Tax=Diploscapter pachys TaxID=2018661 RepID=A0A2A2LFZ2_9BILA|nr:hypothetical protein WR25_04529 [Diploscapter pachys]